MARDLHHRSLPCHGSLEHTRTSTGRAKTSGEAWQNRRPTLTTLLSQANYYRNGITAAPNKVPGVVFCARDWNIEAKRWKNKIELKTWGDLLGFIWEYFTTNFADRSYKPVPTALGAMATKDNFSATNDQRVPDHPDSDVSLSSKECVAQSSALQQQAGCSSGDVNALRRNTNLNSCTEGAYGVSIIGRGNVVSTTTAPSAAPMVQELDTVSPSPVEVDDDAAVGFSTFCSAEGTSKSSSLDQEIRRLQVLKLHIDSYACSACTTWN